MNGHSFFGFAKRIPTKACSVTAAVFFLPCLTSLLKTAWNIAFFTDISPERPVTSISIYR